MLIICIYHRLYTYSYPSTETNGYTNAYCWYSGWILYPAGRQISKVHGQSAKGKPTIHEAGRCTVLW